MTGLDDMTILDVARKIGFLDEKQIGEVLEVRRDSPDTELTDILTGGGLLSDHQLRALLVTARYEHTRDEDHALATFAVANGFITKEAVEKALKEQESAYSIGEPFKRLQDILLEGNLINAAQMQMILRARAQIEATRVQLLATGAAIPTKPPTRRYRTPKETQKAKEPEPVAERPAPPPPTPVASIPMPLVTKRTMMRPPPSYVEDFLKKHPEAAILGDTFKVATRRTKMRTGARDLTLAIIDCYGAIDDAVEGPWESYLAERIDSVAGRVVLNLEEVKSISSGSLRALAQASRNCRDREGDLRLYGVSAAIKKAIKDAGYDTMLRIYDGERGVVMSYRYM